jgi:hypothetical protein
MAMSLTVGFAIPSPDQARRLEGSSHDWLILDSSDEMSMLFLTTKSLFT